MTDLPHQSEPIADKNGLVTPVWYDKLDRISSDHVGQPGVNIEDFGGVGDGVTDNTGAFNATIASFRGTGGAIYFPPGKYRFDTALSVTFPDGVYSVSLCGGGQDNTILYFPNVSGGITFNYVDFGQSVHVRDLTFTTGQNGTTFGLSLVRSANFLETYPMNDIFRVTFRGDDSDGSFSYFNYWGEAALINGVSGTSWDTVTVIGGAGTGVGLHFMGPGLSADQYAINHAISNSSLNSLLVGINYDSYSQGIMVDQTSFFNDFAGIFVPPSVGGFLSQLMVTNCAFQMFPTSPLAAIQIDSRVVGVQVCNNVFLPSDIAPAIYLAFSTFGFNIVGNQITPGYTIGAGYGVVIAETLAGTNGVITGNTITNMLLGVWLQASAARVLVTGNTFTGNTTAITDAGTDNVLTNNLGYNPVGSTNIAVGASPFTYTAGSSPETVYVINGTITLVSLTASGVWVSLTAPCSVNLDPHDSVTVAYTVAPLMSKTVH